MAPFTVALASLQPHIADKKRNLALMERTLKKTKADLYVFGEFFLTGDRCKDEYRDLAEPLTGPTLAAVQELACRHKCYIITGMAVKDDKVNGLIYNCAVLAHPSGTLDVYHKWFLPTFGPFEEKIFFDQGEDLNVFPTAFGKIGMLVCYDVFFPELAKALALQGADFIVYISAAPSVNRPFFETILPARAIENTVFVAYANLAGTQEDLVHFGGSQLYSPLGKCLVKAPYLKESVVTCTIDLADVEIARARRPVLRDIRPEIYHDLYTFARTHKKQ